jgi:hypothetical protein
MMPDDKPNPFQDKTARKPPYSIPNDTTAKDATFSGPADEGPVRNETRYRYSPDMDRQIMVDSANYHEAGEEAAYIDFGAVSLVKGGTVYPDAIGLGEGEQTPFAAQQGQHPEGSGGKMLKRPTGGFVQAAMPVKSDVPANR